MQQGKKSPRSSKHYLDGEFNETNQLNFGTLEVC